MTPYIDTQHEILRELGLSSPVSKHNQDTPDRLKAATG